MNPELKVVIYEQRKLFKKLLDLLDEQHEFIINKEVTKMDKIAKDLENISRDIAKLEIQRRNIITEEVSMSSLIENCEDEKIKEAYEEINYYDNIVTLRKIPSVISRNGYSSARIVDIEFDGKPMALYCYLKLMGNP